MRKCATVRVIRSVTFEEDIFLEFLVRDEVGEKWTGRPPLYFFGKFSAKWL